MYYKKNSKNEELSKQCSYKYIKYNRCGYKSLHIKLESDCNIKYKSYMESFGEIYHNPINLDELPAEWDDTSLQEDKINGIQNEDRAAVCHSTVQQGLLKQQEKIGKAVSKFSPSKLDKYKEHYKNNTYKNILSAFQKHIEKLDEPDIIKTYESLTEDKWSFQYIQIRVSQNLKKCGRFHLKLKNLLNSKNLKNIFIYFLKNSNAFWIEQSKVKDKAKLKKSIDQLINQSSDKSFVDSISFYKKAKKIY